MTDGTLYVLVGRLSLSDTVSNTTEPVRLLFNDSNDFVTCYVSTPGGVKNGHFYYIDIHVHIYYL